MYPPTEPLPAPAVKQAPVQHRVGCAPPAPPPPAAQAAAQQPHAVAVDAHHRAMLEQLKLLTPQQLQALPPAQREQIRSLLAQQQEAA